MTFGVCESTSDSDRHRFGVTDKGRVVVIEAAWLAQVVACVIYLYELPSDSFNLWDKSAGYWVSRQMVVPLGVTVVRDLPSAITERRRELRIVHRLWSLHDAVRGATRSKHFSRSVPERQCFVRRSDEQTAVGNRWGGKDRRIKLVRRDKLVGRPSLDNEHVPVFAGDVNMAAACDR